MGKPRKWERGGRIDTAELAMALILSGAPLYERNKLQTAGWMRSWQINYVMAAVYRGHLYIAVPANRNPTP